MSPTSSTTTSTQTATSEPTPEPQAGGPGPFSREFLTLLEATDDGPTAAEAETFGPWEVHELGERFGVFREWDRTRLDAGLDPVPTGLFLSRYHALLCAAVLGGLYTDPVYRVEGEPTPRGYPLLALSGDRWVQPAGWVPWPEDRLAQALDVAAALVRTPQALASLLEAAGPTNLKLAMEVLHHRWQGQARHWRGRLQGPAGEAQSQES